MNKRLFSVVLILAMVIFLFAGCGKPSTPPNPLRGTWRLDEDYYNEKIIVDGVMVDEVTEEETYPFTENHLVYENLTVEYQPYYQFKNKFRVLMKFLFENAPEELTLPSGYFFILIKEIDYSVSAKKIIADEGKSEANYTLDGDRLYIYTVETEEGYWYDEELDEEVECIYEYRSEQVCTRVPDSEIGNLTTFEDYPDLEDL